MILDGKLKAEVGTFQASKMNQLDYVKENSVKSDRETQPTSQFVADL